MSTDVRCPEWATCKFGSECRHGREEHPKELLCEEKNKSKECPECAVKG